MSKAKIGLGCVTFGREIGRRDSFALLDAAVERGVDLLDTAAAYGNGASEEIVGEWLRSRPDAAASVEVATKILPPFHASEIRGRVEESCSRMGVPEIDLLYLHSWDPTVGEHGVLAALDELLRDGKVRRLGVSNVEMGDLLRVRKTQEQLGFAPFSVIQNNFNYAVRDLTEADRKVCREHGIAVVTYSPLGAGFLTGKHRNGVEKGSRFDVIPGHQDVYFTAKSWDRLDRLENAAKTAGVSQAHLAMAWAFSQPDIDYVLIGARKLDHLEQAFLAREEDVELLSGL